MNLNKLLINVSGINVSENNASKNMSDSAAL